jgi:hypothetical protein
VTHDSDFGGWQGPQKLKVLTNNPNFFRESSQRSLPGR